MASPPHVLLASLLLYTYGVQVSWSQCHNSTELSIRLDSLLAEYERDLPPPSRAGLVVYVSLDVKHATIAQETSTMRLLTDLKMVWKDQRLEWNQTDWGCDYAITSAERLWLPDIVLLNAAATGVSSSPNDVGLRARVDSVGTVTWVMRLDVTAPIALELYDWPRDTQSCIFRFGSRSYSFDEVELRITELRPAVVFESGPWEIKSMTGATALWQRGEEAASVASWSLALRRRAPAHALAATCVLLGGVLLLGAALALLPAQRAALAACTSFTSSLWLMSALGRLPGAAAVPRALALQCALCVAGACACACAALVRRVARCSAPPPRLLRTLLSNLSTLCRLTPAPEVCPGAEPARGAWAAAALLLDRTLNAALLLAMLVLLIVQLC